MNDRDRRRLNRVPYIPLKHLTREQRRLGTYDINDKTLNKTLKDIIKNHEKKTIIFNQFAGIGDILFIEPIIRKYFIDGHSVILPVQKDFLNLQANFPYIKFIDMDLFDINYDEKKIVENENFIILPLRFSNNMMSNKYKMVDMNFDLWKTLTWLRHRFKEEKLKKLLGIEAGDKYNLINKNFTSIQPFQCREINVKNEYKNIIMTPIDGFNLLDWSGVIESASTIHTVNTSILYLLEILELSTKDIHLYSRNVNGLDFKDIEYLFNIDFKKHK